MDKILEVRDLEKKFGSFTAVKDLTFDVFEGDIYGFLGPNGAGKSTTLRMILGLIYSDSGSIKFLNNQITHNDRHYLNNIGALIERPDFYGNLTAYDNLKIFGELSKVSNLHNRIVEVLEQVDLISRKSSKVKTFSQGMKQRLGIAQAIIHKPKLVILDEPSNGLDPQGQYDIKKLILRINQEMGITVLFSSHILTEVEEICNRMIIINKGTKIKEGNVSELMNEDVLNVFIKSVENEHLNQTLNKLGLKYKANGTGFIVELQEQKIPQLVKQLTDNNVRILELYQNRSLENYFLKLINN